MEPALAGRRSAKLNSWQPPPPPIGVRPTAPPPMVTTYGNIAPSNNVARSSSNSGTTIGTGARRASVPQSLRPSTPAAPPPSYSNNGNAASSRNRSWDGVYGAPTGGGSARMPRGSGNGRPGSSDSNMGSRARAPVFPSVTGTRNLDNVQERSRRPPPPPPTTTRPAHWVDPEKWNGPAR